jgi:PEP-CTERM motif
MLRYFSVAGMLLVAVLLFVQPSKADNFATFELVGHGLDITFTLPQGATPASLPGGLPNFQNITGSWGFGGTYNFATVQIGTSGYLGMTNYWAFGSQDHSIALIAPGLFTLNPDGTVTLNAGIYSIGAVGAPHDYTLTVVDHSGGSTGVPEPASLVLLGIGGLAVAAFRRRQAS